MRRVTAIMLAALLGTAVAAPPGQARTKPRLRAFQDCSSVIRYGNRFGPRFRAGARPAPVRPVPVSGPVMEDVARPSPVAAPVGAGEDFSTTNVQEGGVDEPDVVKTDGRTVFALAGGRLHAVDVSGEAPVARDAVSLGPGHGHQMLLEGDRALVIWSGFTEIAADQPRAAQRPVAPTFAPVPYRSTTVLALVDVGDPYRLRLLQRLTVDGDVLAGRSTGSLARVVLATTPRAIAEGVVTPGARTSKVDPRRANAWLPAGTFVNARTARSRRRALVRCNAVRHPRAFSGLGTLAVLTLDLDKGLEPVDSDALMTGAETVYASPGNLYVATQRYMREVWTETSGRVPARTTTQIHRFEIEGPTTTYRGSGEVPGFLLSQFSMSERGGVLRTASTSVPPWFGQGEQSQSYVTMLELTAGGLPRLGQVGGLGTGERIYSVRFLDDAGYVVTFRQVDPLYALDLSSPEDPKVRGELKILGYSAYLHPAGKGRLIGVGQDATEEGRTLGTQISLFDVSDLSAPALLQRATVGSGASSSVEYDHHAFLWWPARDLAVLPVSIYDVRPLPGPDAPSTGISNAFTGAIGFKVADAGIAEAGRVTHDGGGYPAMITRSLVVGDRLYTLSEAGLKASRLDTLADAAFVAF